MMSSLTRDLRLACRMLAARPAWTFAGLATLLGATAWIALYLPSRWASKLDLARTLRGD
jgi:hypothetical protein